MVLGSGIKMLSVLLHRADIALIGLAVMGQNLILNMNDHGFVVSKSLVTSHFVASFLVVHLIHFFVYPFIERGHHSDGQH